jgi:hypothetical protein
MIPEVIALDAPRWMDAVLMLCISLAAYAAAFNVASFGASTGRIFALLGWCYMGTRFTLSFAVFGDLQISISGMPALLLLSAGQVLCAVERVARQRHKRRSQGDQVA